MQADIYHRVLLFEFKVKIAKCWEYWQDAGNCKLVVTHIST